MSRGGGTAIGRGHARIGVMACLACAREIPVKKTPGEKLSICCTWCDLPLYVNPRTEAFALVMRKVKLDPPAPIAAAEASPPASSSPSAEKQTEGKDHKQPAPAPEERKDPPRRTFAGPLFGR